MSHDSLEIDLEVDEQYMIGLLDHLARPILQPEPSDSGYRLNSSVVIPLRRSDLLAGLIGQFLSNQDIKSNIRYSDNSPKLIEINTQSSIISFSSFMDDGSFQIAERLEYIRQYIERYKRSIISSDPNLFLNIFEPWAELHPEWGENNSKKYTLAFFEDKYDIEQAPNPDDVPSPNYPQRMTDSYVAGVFDAVGYLQFRVQKASDRTIGYSMSPGIQIGVSHPSSLILPHFKKYFSDLSISPSIAQKQSRANVTITRTEDLMEFFEIVEPFIFRNYEISVFFKDDLLPAYAAGHHHDKSGFLECLQAYEEVTGKPASKKFDADYFENLWNV